MTDKALIDYIEYLANDSCEKEECECFHGANLDLILQKIEEHKENT